MRIWRFDRNCALFLLLAILVPPMCMQASGGAPATFDSPVGRWKTIDDHTGQAKAIVEIREVDGKLEGRIVKLFHPPAPYPLCLKCRGALKNKPVMGMRILWGMLRDGSEWTGGHVLDPESGNVYRCTMMLENGGKTLRLRGYVGLSVFGRTEKWVRVEDRTE
ncbi:MAG: DUF2147 domain-containing protein [Terracidiphilus sp.]